MTAKIHILCVKVSTVLIFLLFFQGINAQFNFVGLDQKLDASKKELGGAGAQKKIPLVVKRFNPPKLRRILKEPY